MVKLKRVLQLLAKVLMAQKNLNRDIFINLKWICIMLYIKTTISFYILMAACVRWG